MFGVVPKNYGAEQILLIKIIVLGHEKLIN